MNWHKIDDNWQEGKTARGTCYNVTRTRIGSQWVADRNGSNPRNKQGVTEFFWSVSDAQRACEEDARFHGEA